MRFRKLAARLSNTGLPARLACGVLAVVLAAAVFAPEALATRGTRPISSDSRIHVVMYTPDEVYTYTGHYGYQSSIIFEKGEEIQTISMGDSTAWMMTPSGNRLFLKPVEQDAETNMTLLTNKRSYLFELHAREAEGIDDPELIWVLRFIYPTQTNRLSKLDPVPDPKQEGIENFNFNYTIRGSYEISPVKIYDDGEFTYFQFRGKNTEIPAIFMVDQYGKEYLVNYRTRGTYIVVERVASRYTLRQGTEVVCVYNESRPFPRSMMGEVPPSGR